MKKTTFMLVAIMLTASLLAAAMLAGCSVTVTPNSASSQQGRESSSPSQSAPSSSRTESSSSSEAPQSSEPSSSKPENSAPGDLLAKSYIDIMSGDKFYLKTRMLLNAEGETSEMAVEIAKDGEDVAAKMEIEGMVINMVMKDGKMYMVMHELETVMVMDMPAEQAQEQMMVPDTSDLEFVEAGTDKLFGRTLSYEAYRVKDGDGEETRFYFDGTKFVGMQSFIDGVEAVSMEILELSTNIPASLFDIPSNYQVTDMFGG